MFVDWALAARAEQRQTAPSANQTLTILSFSLIFVLLSNQLSRLLCCARIAQARNAQLLLGNINQDCFRVLCFFGCFSGRRERMR